MTKMRKFTTLTAAAALAAMTLPALALDSAIKDVTVSAANTELNDANALLVYPDIERDLRTVIIQRLNPDVNAQGYEIDVHIDKVSLDGDTILPDNKEFNELEGAVTVKSSEAKTGEATFPVRIAAESADMVSTDGVFVISPDAGDFYMAMLNGFAQVVEEQLPEAIKQADSAR